MENIIFGIPTILLCSAGYFFSWRYYKQNNYRVSILLLALSGSGLLIYVSTDFYLHLWDERFHALVAKNLILHPLVPTLYDNPVLPFDYKNWTGNHIWLHKQPLPLWTMAASLRVFGVNEIALRIPSIILTATGTILTYYIGEYFFNRKTGYLAAFLFSINGLIIEMAGGRIATDHIDIFFMFFIELSIFLSIRFVQTRKNIYNILTGLGIGAAILTKWLPALIVLPVWILLVTDSGKFRLKSIISQFTILIITIVAVSLPWQLYIFSTFPAEAAWELSFNSRHYTEVLEGHSGSIFFFVNKIRINYGELIYLPLGWFLWRTLRNLSDKKRLAICIWFIVPFLFFSFSKTKMQGYILFTAPALFLMTSEFFFMLSDYKKGRRLKWLYNIILILLIALPVRYCNERVKPFRFRDRNPQWVIDLKNLDKENIKNGILFNYSHPVEAMFYTNLTAYKSIPQKEIIKDLRKQGYMIIINDDGKITEQTTMVDGLLIVKLSPPGYME